MRVPRTRLVAGSCTLAVAASAVLVSAQPAASTTTATTTTAALISPAVPMCGVANVSSVRAPANPAPTNAVHAGPGGFSASYFTIANGELHVLDQETRVIRRFTLDGAPLSTVNVPFRLSAPSFAVDDAGDMYLAQYPDTMVKLSATGKTLWTRGVAAPEILAVFGIGTGTSFRAGVVGRGEKGSTLLDAAGSAAGRSDVTGTTFSPRPAGGVVATDGRYVRHYNRGGRLLSVFGDVGVANEPSPTGGPFHFYQQGGAVALPDGSTYIADATRGLLAASAGGFYRGRIPDETLGHVTERSSLAVAGGRLYFASGGRFNSNQRISWISLTDVAALVRSPKPPDFVLGYGAGLATGVRGNWFPHGRVPSLTARFDPWWVRHAPRLRLSYTVRNRDQVASGTAARATVVALPTTAAGLERISLALPRARPGAYEVDARLLDAKGVVRGATCVTYTVGSPSHRLDFTSLPAGADYGGPAPARGVALAQVLGGGNFRGRVEWSRLLPDPAGPMQFDAYDAAFRAAAKEAAARNVTFHVQVGEGGPVEKALVANGTWGARVQELVAHFRGTVRVWEAWNEPNITFGPPDAYVNQVLKPFTEAVKSVDPSAKVIGGSVVGVDVGYYEGIGRAGGFALMDVIAVHPYTGHNRSWEEHGTPAALKRLRAALNAHGGQGKQLWNTEFSWWSDGAGNFVAQADKLARAMLWMRALGVKRWNYFITEGGYGDYGLSYSLIQSAAEPDDYVKPAALASMTASAHTTGRRFAGMVSTGIPHAYAASFGRRSGGRDTVLAAWTADLRIGAKLTASSSEPTVTVTATDVLGAARTLKLRPGRPVPLTLSGSPVYLTAPAGVRLQLRPAHAVGGNVASAAAGARAYASSAGPRNPAAAAIDGVVDAAHNGDLPGLPAWASAPGDAAPSLTVEPAKPTRLDRVLVSSHSLGSIVPGIRRYDVAVRHRQGTWVTVARVRDRTVQRQRLVRFSARSATAVRVKVAAVSYGGLAAGLKPWFWPTDSTRLRDPDFPWYGPAVIYELQAYGPSR